MNECLLIKIKDFKKIMKTLSFYTQYVYQLDFIVLTSILFLSSSTLGSICLRSLYEI